MSDLLKAFLDNPAPTVEEAIEVFTPLTIGEYDDIQIAALLIHIRTCGSTFPATGMDTAGTGGDGANTINITTAASLVAAAGGVKMVKHGNRSKSSKSGSAGISVPSEPKRFGGDHEHLATVAASTHLPVLCKDFIVESVRVRAAGANYGGFIFGAASPCNVSRETAEEIKANEPGLTYVTVTRGKPLPGFINQLQAPYQGSLEAELDYIGDGPSITKHPELAGQPIDHVVDSGGPAPPSTGRRYPKR